MTEEFQGNEDDTRKVEREDCSSCNGLGYRAAKAYEASALFKVIGGKNTRAVGCQACHLTGKSKTFRASE